MAHMAPHGAMCIFGAGFFASIFSLAGLPDGHCRHPVPWLWRAWIGFAFAAIDVPAGFARMVGIAAPPALVVAERLDDTGLRYCGRCAPWSGLAADP